MIGFNGPPPIKAERDRAAADALDSHVRQARVHRIAAARAAVVINAKAHFVYEGCASFGEFGERHGLSASEAWALLSLGHALAQWPEIEAELLAGRMPEESAARMGRVSVRAGAVRPNDEWVAWAKGEPAKAFARRVKQRLEEVRASGASLLERTFYVTQTGADLFEKARTIASRKAGRILTEGEALETVSDHYLDDFDITRQADGKRRMPDTATIEDRDKRTLAAEVRRGIARRGDRCAVPLCTNQVFLHKSHRVAHAQGGARELEDIDDLCRVHHAMYHSGDLVIRGTTEQPVFLTRDGRPLDGRIGFAVRPRATPARAEPVRATRVEGVDAKPSATTPNASESADASAPGAGGANVAPLRGPEPPDTG